MDAVRLCVIGEQVAVFVAELCVQVQVVQAALLAQGLDLLVDGADVVRRKAGGVVLDGLLRGAQNGLHVKGGVGQRGAQLVQHAGVVIDEAVLVAGLHQGVGAQQEVELGGLVGGQHVEGYFLAAVRAGDSGAVDDGVGADAAVAADERAAHIDVVLVGAETCGEGVTQESGIGKPAGAHAAKLAQLHRFLRCGGVGVAGIGALLLRTDCAPVESLHGAAGIATVGARVGQRGHQLGGARYCRGFGFGLAFHTFGQDQRDDAGQRQDTRCRAQKGGTAAATAHFPAAASSLPPLAVGRGRAGRLLRRRSGACPIPLPGIFSFGARAARFLRRWHRRALLCLQIAMQY